MNLHKKLTLSLTIIGLVVLIGLGVILQSVSGVKNIAQSQQQQVAQQTEQVHALSKDAKTVVPALQFMNTVAQLQKDLADVRFAYANASLTFVNDDLTKANNMLDALKPKLIRFLNEHNSRDTAAVEEAFWAARIYGNKLNEFLLKDLTMSAGDMATGLTKQINVISSVLSQYRNSSVKSVDENIVHLMASIEKVNISANQVKTGTEVTVKEAELVTYAVISVGIVVIIIATIVAVYIGRTLRSAMKEVVSTLTQISQNKNLSLRINRQQQDELGIIAHDIDGMMETFEQLVVQVSTTAHHVGDEIQKMSDRGDSLNGLVSDQQTALETISTSITEMSAAADEIASNASTTAETTTQANDIGKKSSEAVSESIESIESLSHQLNDSADRINQLASDVASIGSILGVIESIAEQTNLLALNAAIESARAGEHGRGFAVVADEVRTLAARTQDSVVEIRSTIDTLTSRTNEVVDAIHQSQQTSEQSVEQAQQTNVAIQDISHALSEIMDLTQLIATAANQQSIASSEVSDRVNTLSHASHKISTLAEENQDGGHTMAAQGEELNQVISIFTVK